PITMHLTRTHLLPIFLLTHPSHAQDTDLLSAAASDYASATSLIASLFSSATSPVDSVFSDATAARRADGVLFAAVFAAVAYL
ncbi:unnamed protein product, partial [Aureobasidium vineae]